MENECDRWGTSPVSFPIFVVSSSCKRVSGRWKKLKWSFGNAFWQSLVALCRWSLNPVKIYSINRRGGIKVVVYSRWSFNEGGRLGRFDCTSMSISGLPTFLISVKNMNLLSSSIYKHLETYLIKHKQSLILGECGRQVISVLSNIFHF
jgi:hypothetical protein